MIKLSRLSLQFCFLVNSVVEALWAIKYKHNPITPDKQEYTDIQSSGLLPYNVVIMPTPSNINDMAFKAKTVKIELFFEEVVLVISVLNVFTVMSDQEDNELIAII